MALPTCNEDMNIISKLDDEPNDVGGLSAAALKAKFDLAGNLLKKALNDLVAALGENAAAKNIGFAPTAAVNKTNVQDAIENVQSQIAGVSQGGVADGAVTAAKIADGAVGTAAIAADAITAEKLSKGAVNTNAIGLGAVTESKIGYYAVTEQKIASKAVTGEKIADRTINSAKMDDASVTERALCAGAVTNDKVGYKALGEEISVTPSFMKPGGTASVNSCVFRYVKAIGVMLFQIELLGLSQQEAASGVNLTFSGLDKLPSDDAGFAAVVQVASMTGPSGFALANACFYEGGGLRIVYPDGVSTGGTVITSLSGWYFC